MGTILPVIPDGVFPGGRSDTVRVVVAIAYQFSRVVGVELGRRDVVPPVGLHVGLAALQREGARARVQVAAEGAAGAVDRARGGGREGLGRRPEARAVVAGDHEQGVLRCTQVTAGYMDRTSLGGASQRVCLRQVGMRLGGGR